jgi:flagellar biosynthesis/type III secretory pathway protein FliH
MDTSSGGESMTGEQDGAKQWEQKGLEKGLEQGREVLLRELDRRFGPLPAEARQRVEAIGSVEELTELSLRIGAKWLRDSPQVELNRTFAKYIAEDLIPSRVPGAVLPEVKDLQELKSVLAGLDWTKQWKQEGFEEGHKEGLEKARGAFLRELKKRFGRLPRTARQRVETIGSIEEVIELTFHAGAASTLADLELS